MEDGLKENKDRGQKKDLKEVSVTFEKRSYLQGFQKVDSKTCCWASQVVLVAKDLPYNAGDIRDTGSIVGQEYPLEKGMTTHSSILVWRIPWTEEPGRLQSIGLQRV